MLAVVVKIDDVFGGAAMEAEGDEGGVQLGILGAGSLAKPVQRLHQLEHLVSLPFDLKAGRLLDEDLFLQLVVQEGRT
jgi:hypothetical protein